MDDEFLGSLYEWTIDTIRKANRARGHHWFEADTMSFFDSRVEPGVYQGEGGIYFVSSEQYHGPRGDSQPRRWTVRQFDPGTGHIETAGPFARLDRDDAIRFARLLAAAAVKTTDILID